MPKVGEPFNPQCLMNENAIILSDDVVRRKMSGQAKFFHGLVLTGQIHGRPVSQEDIKQMLGIGGRQFRSHLARLLRLRLIRRVDYVEAKRILLLPVKRTEPESARSCPWCLLDSPVFENHHFPVSRQQGGDRIVRICITCHRTFHWIQSSYYQTTLTEHELDAFRTEFERDILDGRAARKEAC